MGTERSYVIHGFEPERVFRYFEEISAIPRPSGHEGGVADYLETFAAARGLACERDRQNNVLIRLPATPGREGEAPLLLQGHTDMVCEKNAGTEHDFLRDPLQLQLDGHLLSAVGTSLGGDDGVAVAMMLALLDGEVTSHPALECLFTTEEETGMGGAIAFDYGRLTARHMVNLDSEEEAQVTAGCAGGVRSDLRLPCRWVPAQGTLCRVSISGLCGGHSGENIDCGRMNANLLMGRLLQAMRGRGGWGLVGIAGGTKDNAIPRECEAVLAVDDPAAFGMAFLTLADTVENEMVPEDRGCRICFERLTAGESGKYPRMMEEGTVRTVLAVLTNVPTGVLAMSHEVPGLVEFSRNLGILATDEDEVRMTISSRSAKDSQLDASTQGLDALAALCGGTVRHYSRYPGWRYAVQSAVRDAYLAAYADEFGSTPEVKTIHAGLECGYIAQQIPEMDMISVGPDMKGIHSPDEVLDLASVERVWRVLARVITGWKVPS